jgi:hypothetical protein
MRVSLYTRFITLQKMDEGQGSTTQIQNKNNYRSQQNWVHPKKFHHVKALHHQNPSGNRMSRLNLPKHLEKKDQITDTKICKFNINVGGRYTSQDFYKKKKDAFKANFSVKKLETEAPMTHRTLFPAKTQYPMVKRPWLETADHDSSQDFTSNFGKTGAMIKIDRMCVDKDLLKKTRRQFYPKKSEALR